jgi:hypothetical protein
MPASAAMRGCGPGEQDRGDPDSRQVHRRDDVILGAVYGRYFVTEQIYGCEGAIELSRLQCAIDDMADEGDIFKVAPPLRKLALDPSLGAIMA